MDRAVATKVLGFFLKVPDIFTKLFPLPIVVHQNSAREVQIKKGKTTPPLVAVGAAVTAKGGAGSSTTNKTPPKQKNDMRKDGLDETHKHKGIFKSTNNNKLAYLKNPSHNPNVVDPPTKFTIGSTADQQIRVKGSTVSLFCKKENCNYSHLFSL